MRSVGLRVLGTLLLIESALAVGGLMLEGGVRLYTGKVAQNLFAFDRELGWIHNASARRYPIADGTSYLINIDALGLRGRPHDLSSDRKRVLVLGDSFTEGFQVSNDEVVSSVW